MVSGRYGCQRCMRIDEIHDGASNTILVGEIRAGLIPQDTRGVWAMSGGCPSALWAHGWISDANGPNDTEDWGDDARACTEIERTIGGSSGQGSQRETKVIQLGMSCWPGNGADFQQTARSMYAGGVNVCFADGSIHWISDGFGISRFDFHPFGARPASGPFGQHRRSVGERVSATSKSSLLARAVTLTC